MAKHFPVITFTPSHELNVWPTTFVNPDTAAEWNAMPFARIFMWP